MAQHILIFPRKSGRLLGGFLLHLFRRQVVDGGMDTWPIVVAFDVLKQVPFGLLLGCVVFVMNELGFERVEKAFHRSVIPTVTLA